MGIVQNRLAVVGIGAVTAAVVGWLAFGYFGVQSLIVDDEVNEAGPVFDSGVGDEAEEIVESDEFKEAMAEAAEAPTEVSEETMPGEVVTLAQGSFTGYTGHEVVGSALVLNDGTEQRFLRLENFESTNGPDLNVYLRASDGEFVDLGDLKGNIGDQNYEIPVDTDLGRFNTVEIWCVRFSVLFGDATLA
jgi:hypothetical protein